MRSPKLISTLVNATSKKEAKEKLMNLDNIHILDIKIARRPNIFQKGLYNVIIYRNKEERHEQMMRIEDNLIRNGEDILDVKGGFDG